MYLRPTPATVDPSVPGSTRRQQISVRPGAAGSHVGSGTTRGHPPPPKRSAPERSERAASERTSTERTAAERGGSERHPRRERPPEPVASASSRPPASRPRTAMVVSPVSLTPEEVQPGARPKMPTLLGLGAAMDTPQVHASHSHPSPFNASGSHPSSAHAGGAELQSTRRSAVDGARQAELAGSDPSARRSAAVHRAAGEAAAKPPGSDPMASDAAAGARASGRRAKGAARADRHDFARSAERYDAARTAAAAAYAALNDGAFAPGSSAAPLDDGYALGAAASALGGASFFGSGEPTGFDALALQIAVEAPNDIAPSVQLLADFALKLSLGPISRLWVPDVRRSVDALLLTGKHRNETALVALSTRLLDVLPNDSRDQDASTACPPSAASDAGAASAPDAEADAGAKAAAGASTLPDARAVPDAGARLEGESGSDAGAVGETPAASELDSASVTGAAAEANPAPEASPASEASPAAEGGAAAEASPAPDASSPSELAAPELAAAALAASDSRGADIADDDDAGSTPASPLSEDVHDGAPLDGVLRERILHEVSRLAGVLPEWPAAAQDLAEEARRRETRVVRELLSQIDGLKRDQRARLEEQMRLEDLAAMASQAIADEFDAPLERADEVHRLLDSYRRERQTRAPDVGNAIGLSLALDDLERCCQAFDDCDPEQKDVLRVLRAERRQALSAVNLLLAERGELDWLEQIEPLAIGERVERLKQWLDAGGERAY